MSKIPEDMSYHIVKKVGIISQLPNGHVQEANIIAWNGHKPAMDIRRWDDSGTKPRYGITLSETEMNKLISAYLEWRKDHNELTVPEEHVYHAGSYSVYEVLGILSDFDRGYRKELTISADIDNVPMLELRKWKKDHRGRGKGIAFTLPQADQMIKLLIWYRDGSRIPKLTSVSNTDQSENERRRIHCVFSAKEQIDVIAAIQKIDGKLENNAWITKYACSSELTEFIPKEIEEKVIKEAKRQILMKKTKPTETKTQKAADMRLTSVSREMREAETFGDRIRTAIKHSGFSGRAISKAAGAGECMASYWARQKKKEHTVSEQVKAVADLLGVNPEWLGSGKLPILAKDITDEAEIPKETVAPEEKPEMKPVVKVQHLFGEDRMLDAINSCIYCLAKTKPVDARSMHRFFADIRTELEEKLLFGEENKTSESWTEKDAEYLRSINDVIFRIRDLALEESVADDIYTYLSEKRFDLELRMIH